MERSPNQDSMRKRIVARSLSLRRRYQAWTALESKRCLELQRQVLAVAIFSKGTALQPRIRSMWSAASSHLHLRYIQIVRDRED